MIIMDRVDGRKSLFCAVRIYDSDGKASRKTHKSQEMQKFSKLGRVKKCNKALNIIIGLERYDQNLQVISGFTCFVILNILIRT